ncbi:glycosyltransferase family 4 protein [Aneurinibacillus tyrosinisolvens]|uniref:glycosyltransferase family 4 protein n=1 Tax=Aneurinibacillus tyrosinisolvens TaxID=1443435 RepID=UPI000699DBA2|nr:glycosyltransferase family 4 protein [Aneurinibacillus tyrosinisolvens]
MKLLIIAPPMHPVSSTTGSSVEIAIYQIAKRISRSHEVTVLGRKGERLPAFSRRRNLTFVRVLPGNGYVRRAIRYAKKGQFDCIQVENRPKYILDLRVHFPSTPLILVLHSFTFLDALPIEIRRTVIQQADAIICNSHYVQEAYKRQFPDNAHKFHAIHLGVDVTRFSFPGMARKNRELSRHSLERTFNILYAGRVVPRKGVHILIKAAGYVREKYPFVRLLIAGPCNSEKYKARLMAEAQRCRVPVRFIGPVKPHRMHKVYWLGDCFVCPTQYEEAFGLVNVEAMASRLPVIASRRGGIPEIIDEQTGILVADYQDPAAFARAIERIITMPTFGRVLSKGAERKAAQQFDWDNVSGSYDRFYSGLLAQGAELQLVKGESVGEAIECEEAMEPEETMPVEAGGEEEQEQAVSDLDNPAAETGEEEEV